MTQPRKRQINLAVNEDERDAIQEAADQAGLELSTWCRVVLRYASGMGTLGVQVKRAKQASPWELQG